MNGWICKKCSYGEEIEKLSHAERIFYMIMLLEAEVNNGGFAQFFCNSSGKYSDEIINSLSNIGADKTAEIKTKRTRGTDVHNKIKQVIILGGVANAN